MSRLGRIPRGRLIVVGIVSAVAVGGVLAFVGVKLAQGNHTAGSPTTQPPPPQSFAVRGS